MAEHTGAGDYKHGEMDIAAHQKTFAGFIRFWIFVFGGAICILIFLALFNS
ncbi:aa3-type cytochrome c oxidase subunit IV [Amaricoccus sp.]|uniref:aa3-type cytochrome c oxidase subunit IV n=1 Tax=Amaricoccus sp. TaxID=1872485 RepID=UPI00260DA645|nr:aa3-type cytochrome c oxidase subunit IV [uncultured Amaricoccus sp.]